MREGTYQPSSSSPSLVVELDVLVRDAEVVRRHDGAPDVRGDISEPDRDDDRDRDEQSGDAEQGTTRIAPQKAAVRPTGAPQRHRGEAEQEQPGGDGEQAGEVVARRADLTRVVEGLDPGGDPERPEEQRERAAAAAAQARIGPAGEPEQG